MKYISLSLVFFVSLICLSSIGHGTTSEDEDVSSYLSLGSLSEYSEETINAASEGFLHWEEREYDEAEPHLKRASKKRYTGSMSKYALILLDPEHLIKSEHIKADILEAANLMLMAAMRGNEMAIDYIDYLDKQAKKITIKRSTETGDKIESYGLIDVIKQAPKQEIKRWLKGEFVNKNAYPQKIVEGFNLFFISVLANLGKDLSKKLEAELANDIRSMSVEDEALEGNTVGKIHRYAAESLGLREKITEVPEYTGASQAVREGSHNYTYYNTCHKYPYELDLCTRTLSCSEQAREMLGGEDQRFIRTQSEPFTAGPYYKALAKGKEKKKNPPHLNVPTRFVVDSFYTGASEVFYGNPLWLIETTHMEDPWKSINDCVRGDYGGHWPNTEGAWNSSDPDHNERDYLRKKFQEETKNYISSGHSSNSLFYSLFLISAIDKKNESFVISDEGKKIMVDMRYISKDYFLAHREEFAKTEELTLKYAASFQKRWFKDLSLPKCRLIKYQLDEHQVSKDFEKFLRGLRAKKKIQIENLNGKTPIESQKREKKKPSSESKQKSKKKKEESEKDNLMDGDTISLDMEEYTKESFKNVGPHLKTKRKIELKNLTAINQSWVIKYLEHNTLLTRGNFTYTQKEASSRPLKKMEEFKKTLLKETKSSKVKQSKEPSPQDTVDSSKKRSQSSTEQSSKKKNKK